MTVKTVNYTDEQVAELSEAYKAVADSSEAERDAVVDQFAEKFDRKRRSIIAKLSSLKIYKAKTAQKSGASIRKDQAAIMLRSVTGLPLPSAENLTKVDMLSLIVLVRDLRADLGEDIKD